VADGVTVLYVGLGCAERALMYASKISMKHALAFYFGWSWSVIGP